MAWVLQELRLHQQAEREGVPRELLGLVTIPWWGASRSPCHRFPP